jgi:hypothetical protein
MAHPTASDLKKALLARGFEIYRTSSDEVALAERVRDNLLMDSAVTACTGEKLRVKVTLRAESSSFPGESEEQLYSRARSLGAPAEARGYREVLARAVPIRDPGDRTRILDFWYEVTFERAVADLQELEAELRSALALEKAATAKR